MTFEQQNSRQQNSSAPAPAESRPPRKTSGWRILWAVVTVLSLFANILLVVMLLAIIAVFTARTGDVFVQEVLREGPAHNKIAVLTIEGIIDDAQAEDFRKQIRTARSDASVKALIIRTNSPGGSVSGSDRIHNEIRKYRDDPNKPVVAFMQGLAASGGYYTSVACNKIVAEPTTLTGSIGVIMGHFVLQELLEEKLGIEPVVIKSGKRKDWPSPFEPVTDEQREYLNEKIITPAYERFVDIVAAGRSTTLSPSQVKDLADGSIYPAPEALEKKLIDQVGYIDDAIEAAKSLAGIDKARVVEYKKPFSLSGWLSSRSNAAINIDRKTLQELAVPKLLYLWRL